MSHGAIKQQLGLNKNQAAYVLRSLSQTRQNPKQSGTPAFHGTL